MGGIITGDGVDVLCFAGLEGADVETSLIPLLLLCLGVVVVIGKGEGERLLLLPLDEADEEAGDIFSNVVVALLTAIPVESTQILVAGVICGDLFGIEDVDVADVTTTEEVDELVVDVLLLLFAGCRITKVAEDCEQDLAAVFC